MKQTHKQKKKILYVITKSNWGGAQRYVYDLAINLPKDHYEPVVVVGGSGALKTKLERSLIRVISLPYLGRDINLFYDLAVLASLTWLFIKEKPDIVHLNSSKIGGLGSLAGRVYNGIQKIKKLSTLMSYSPPTKIIFTAHGWAFNEPRNELSKKLITFLSWITIFLSHHTITVSKQDKLRVHNMPAISDKVSCVHNGIQEKKLVSKKEARAALFEGHPSLVPKKEAVWIGTIGELTQNKGLMYAIEACDTLKKKLSSPFVYVIIGDGEDKYKLANAIRKHNLAREVFLVGFKKDASSLLQAFDIFLLPSVKEGLPYVVLEAGFAGIPTVASAIGGIPEIITDGKSGILVPPKDHQHITQAIEFMMTHKEKARELGTHLHQNVSTKFSLQSMLANTLKIYSREA